MRKIKFRVWDRKEKIKKKNWLPAYMYPGHPLYWKNPNVVKCPVHLENITMECPDCRPYKMRKIKFRVWDRIKEEMIYFDDWIFNEEYTLLGFRAIGEKYMEFGSLTNRKEDCIIMQYIGLHDSKGKEIYEGDIYWPPKIKIPLIVEWKKLYNEFRLVGWGYEDGNFEKTEVIGNIYENPELVKGVRK